jgi:hypothetical protein
MIAETAATTSMPDIVKAARSFVRFNDVRVGLNSLMLTATTTVALRGRLRSKALRENKVIDSDKYWQGSLHLQGLATLDCRKVVPTVPVRLVTPHSTQPTPDETRRPTLSDGVAIVAVELRNAKKHVGRRSMRGKRKERPPAGYRGPRPIVLSLTACICGMGGCRVRSTFGLGLGTASSKP